jgi:hypothetical protein
MVVHPMAPFSSADYPFLDNKETLGMTSGLKRQPKKPGFQKPTEKERVAFSRKRSNRFSSLKREAQKMSKALSIWNAENTDRITPEQQECIVRLGKSLNSCCNRTLYREHLSNKALELVAGMTCKHKVCPVCNSNRSKATRKKFLSFIIEEAHLAENYDFMHMTLTVPHVESTEGKETAGWREKEFYAKELISTFNLMRKSEEWKRLVYAGEYCVEVTKNNSGLHIHLHALVLVHKHEGSRNTLHRFVLQHWNRLTVDRSFHRNPFTAEQREAIKKGNKRLTDMDVAMLDPQGATLIGLESLYVKDPKRKSGKRYINPADTSDLVAGVMECMKYHFEPMALKKPDGSYDFELLTELLPNIFRQPMYQKFGAWRGEKRLNINENPSNAEDIKQQLDELGHDNVINPETLEVAMREEYEYVLLNPAAVYHFQQEGNRPQVRKRAKRHYLPMARSLPDALRQMVDLAVADMSRYANPADK